MTFTLEELDKLWEGQNIDKTNLKLLCRKYSPTIILDWIQRGVSLNDRDKAIVWHKNKLAELGELLIEKPEEVSDERLFNDEAGEYFND